jgi:hypothetical protein
VTNSIRALVVAAVVRLAFALPAGSVSAVEQLPSDWLLGSWDGTEGTRTDIQTRLEFSKSEEVIRWKWNRKRGHGGSFEADCEGVVTKLTESGIEMEGRYVYHTNTRNQGKPVRLWLDRVGEMGMSGRAIGSDNATWPLSITKRR